MDTVHGCDRAEMTQMPNTSAGSRVCEIRRQRHCDMSLEPSVTIRRSRTWRAAPRAGAELPCCGVESSGSLLCSRVHAFSTGDLCSSCGEDGRFSFFMITRKRFLCDGVLSS